MSEFLRDEIFSMGSLVCIFTISVQAIADTVDYRIKQNNPYESQLHLFSWILFGNVAKSHYTGYYCVH